jgi:CBS domain-containing protein
MPAKFKKLVQNGAAAILYAQGPGNGWSSSNPKYEGLIYDRDIVRAVLAGDRTRVMTIAKTSIRAPVYLVAPHFKSRGYLKAHTSGLKAPAAASGSSS